MLRVMRDVLNDRFSRTDVVVRTPAVLVPFGREGSESTEIIPAKYIEKDKAGNLVYGIANGSGTWMRSSLDAHNGYVASIDKRLGGKVKPLVRFLKAWKYYQNVPILSFYLELRVAKYASGEGAIVYSTNLRNILKELWDNQLAAMQDPMGVSGYIYPCATDAKKQEALSKLNTALGRAQKARDAEMAKKDSDAFYWWDLLFADKFLAY